LDAQETSWKVPPEIARKLAAPRLTPENAAILERIRATAGTAHLRADLQGAVLDDMSGLSRA
jgi:hypothetical protein